MTKYVPIFAITEELNSLPYYSVRNGKLIPGAISRETGVFKADDVLKVLENVPTQKIVHCRECIYYKMGKFLGPDKFCYRCMDKDGNPIGYNVSEDDFCSKGVRISTGNLISVDDLKDWLNNIIEYNKQLMAQGKLPKFIRPTDMLDVIDRISYFPDRKE